MSIKNSLNPIRFALVILGMTVTSVALADLAACKIEDQSPECQCEEAINRDLPSLSVEEVNWQCQRVTQVSKIGVSLPLAAKWARQMCEVNKGRNDESSSNKMLMSEKRAFDYGYWAQSAAKFGKNNNFASCVNQVFLSEKAKEDWSKWNLQQQENAAYFCLQCATDAKEYDSKPEKNNTINTCRDLDVEYLENGIVRGVARVN